MLCVIVVVVFIFSTSHSHGSSLNSLNKSHQWHTLHSFIKHNQHNPHFSLNTPTTSLTSFIKHHKHNPPTLLFEHTNITDHEVRYYFQSPMSGSDNLKSWHPGWETQFSITSTRVQQIIHTDPWCMYLAWTLISQLIRMYEWIIYYITQQYYYEW